MATLANTDLLEQLEVGDRNSSNSERNNIDEVAKNQQEEVPSPLKGEKYLKMPSIDTNDMDVDLVSKKPRMSMQDKEIVDIDDDDDRFINKGKLL